MAFSYDPSLTTDLDKIRRAINDTVENVGALPNKRNFADEEIVAIRQQEDDWRLAVAACFDALAAAWSTEVNFDVMSGSYSNSDPAKRFREAAADYRKRFGHLERIERASTVAFSVRDGYSL